MPRPTSFSPVPLVLLTLAACSSSASSGSSAAEATSSATSAGASATASGHSVASAPPPSSSASSVARPQGSADLGPSSVDGYPMEGVQVLAADCTTPWIVFSTVKKGAGGIDAWPSVDEMLAVHPQFAVVRTTKSSLDVKLWTFDVDPEIERGSVELAAQCFDGATCNRIAAAFHAVVPSGAYRLACAKTPPGAVGSGVELPLRPSAEETQKKMRDLGVLTVIGSRDTAHSCARIGVCKRKANHALASDPFLECQKSPTSFKLECAKQPTCETVVQCLDGAP